MVDSLGIHGTPWGSHMEIHVKFLIDSFGNACAKQRELQRQLQKATYICTDKRQRQHMQKQNGNANAYGVLWFVCCPQSFHMISYHNPMISYNCHMVFLWFAYGLSMIA